MAWRFALGPQGVDWPRTDVAKAMGGKYEMKTVSGDTLTAEVKKGKLYVMDESGGEAKVTIADVNQSNGVIHVVNKVLLPK